LVPALRAYVGHDDRDEREQHDYGSRDDGLPRVSPANFCHIRLARGGRGAF
jgi:hypothetical protein